MDQSETAVRERTFQWLDPSQIAAGARDNTGLDFLKSLDGLRTAPVAECLGFRLAEVAEGAVTFEITPAEFHYNPIGTVHGGVLATLCDSATGAAVHSTLKKGEAYTTLEIKVQFVRPLTVAAGTVRCKGVVTTRGRRIATAESRVIDQSDRVYALATATCLVFNLEE
jgi:uncharacterized protein (TIGR00369 family)